jgi:hypothetical protein
MSFAKASPLSPECQAVIDATLQATYRRENGSKTQGQPLWNWAGATMNFPCLTGTRRNGESPASRQLQAY